MHSVLLCVVYYALWVWILPHFGRYQIRHERVVLEGGEVTHKLIKVPLEQLKDWDEEHDGQGRKISTNALDNDASLGKAVPGDTKFN